MAKQKKQAHAKALCISADPYIDSAKHINTKKVATNLRLVHSSLNNKSIHELTDVSIDEFNRVNSPQAPAFSSHTKQDAVWGKRVD